MKPAMYIFINKGLGMSPGKIAAQAGHAACEALRLSQVHPPNIPSDDYWMDTRLVQRWYVGGHYAKYVMEARDSEHLRDIERYLNDRGFKTALIIDEGHTEIDPITPTALGVALVDKDDLHTSETFSSFKLYKDETPKVVVIEVERLTSEQAKRVRDLVARGEIGMARDFVKALAQFNEPRGGKRKRWWNRS